jgi:membrane-associated protease RseP (regulator of RpoE activity)
MTDLATRSERPPVPQPGAPRGEHPGSPIGLVLLVGLVLLAGLGGGWPLLVVIGAILGMVFLHELGHYLTAKAAGMKVTEFFIGFGPRIWSFHRGETEYGIKAIPAGAYVKIIGMHNLDEYDEADADRTYMSKPFWRRLSVAVAGSTMHFLLALIGLFALFSWVGVPGGSITDPAWVVSSGIEEGTPAAEAGIEQGDRILSVDGEETPTFERFTEVVRDRPGESVDIVLVRDGEQRTITATLADRHPDIEGRRGFLGVGQDYPEQTVGAADAVGESFSEFGGLVSGTIGAIGDILSPSGLADLGSQVVEGDDPGPTVDSRTGAGGGGSAADDDQNASSRPVSLIGIGDIGTQLVREDLGDALGLFVLLNVFIGVFNLVPLLPLDGGHVAIAVYEKIRSIGRRGEPYHVDVTKLLPLTYAVVLVLVFVGVSSLYLDIADPIGG